MILPHSLLLAGTRRLSPPCIRTRTGTAARLIQHQAAKSKLPPLVFAFDIDGVLLRGPHTIPAARRALDMLNGANPMGVKLPFILLTNGGGVGEEARRRKLSSQLGVELKTNQIVQAHTILKSLAHKYVDKSVLVLGGRNDDVRKVAEGYGFQNVYTTLDVLAWKPEVWPFHDLSAEERATAKPVDLSRTPISAIFVFHDPRNWSLDIQIMVDVIRSRGLIGEPYLDESASTDHQPVELAFCNPDLLWKSDFPQSRLGQGAFRDAFQAVYKAVVGKTYPYVQYGKPTTATYKFAENVLRDQLEELHGGPVEQMPPIYMVGDNPESDIAGANGAGWPSILVQTGVYDPTQGSPTHTPIHTAENVAEAVRWAVDREAGWPEGESGTTKQTRLLRNGQSGR